MRRKFLLTIFSVLATSCASSGEPIDRESPNALLGYNHGCTSAREASKSFSTERERDAYLFENDANYRYGWRQGYLECESRRPNLNDGGRVLGDEERF